MYRPYIKTTENKRDLNILASEIFEYEPVGITLKLENFPKEVPVGTLVGRGPDGLYSPLGFIDAATNSYTENPLVLNYGFENVEQSGTAVFGEAISKGYIYGNKCFLWGLGSLEQLTPETTVSNKDLKFRF